MRKIQSLEAYIFAAKIILSSKYKYLYIIYKYILYRRKKLKPGQHHEKKNKNNARISIKNKIVKQNRGTQKRQQSHNE
jgi:hypothetical protein